MKVEWMVTVVDNKSLEWQDKHCVCTGNLGSFDRVDAHGAMEVGGGKALSSQVGSVIMLGSRGGKEPERVREELPSWGNDEDRALQEWKRHSGEPPEPQVVNEKGRALIGPHEDQAGQQESRQNTVSLSGEDCAAEGSCQPRLSCLAVLLRAEELMLPSPGGGQAGGSPTKLQAGGRWSPMLKMTAVPAGRWLPRAF